MSAVAAKPTAGGAMNPTAMAVGVVLLIIILGVCWYLSPNLGLMALIGIIVGGVLIGFGTHFVPVGGAPAAMDRHPVSRLVSQCLPLVQVLPDSSEEHGQQARVWSLQSSPAVLVAV